jgi:NAD(P)-dependent dehydrogenase (short-subunit alcohol dehydrogenase family)
MLTPDLDLEADLSIDSIKRTEILAELAAGLNLGATDPAMLEELSRLKTIRAIADWLTRDQIDAPAEPPHPDRYIVSWLPTEPTVAAGDALTGRHIVIVPDATGTAVELAVLLKEHGADVRTVDTGDPLPSPPIDALVHLDAAPPTAFPLVRDALVRGTGRVLLVGREGTSGLARTLAREFPDAVVRAADIDPAERPGPAAHLLTELLIDDGPATVRHRAGARLAPRVVPAPLDPVGPLGLTPDSVVLLTGGARGITAQVALGLARAGGCHVELVGRSPLPLDDEDTSLAAAADASDLRRLLATRGIGGPAEIEAEVRRVLAAREIRGTLDALRDHAASVRYHAADVRDAAAIRRVVDDVIARHSRLDGVVHGAGVLEDKLARDKTPDSFARVYGTKVDGAKALVDAVGDALSNGSRFLILFGSVSGVFGNRGQADYSAANDALDTLAATWAGRFGRVVSVDWGPWAAARGGMVSDALEREYARRGIGLIDPAAGVACLLDELSLSAPDAPAQVVYMCGTPEAFEGTSGV